MKARARTHKKHRTRLWGNNWSMHPVTMCEKLLHFWSSAHMHRQREQCVIIICVTWVSSSLWRQRRRHKTHPKHPPSLEKHELFPNRGTCAHLKHAEKGALCFWTLEKEMFISRCLVTLTNVSEELAAKNRKSDYWMLPQTKLASSQKLLGKIPTNKKKKRKRKRKKSRRKTTSPNTLAVMLCSVAPYALWIITDLHWHC